MNPNFTFAELDEIYHSVKTYKKENKDPVMVEVHQSILNKINESVASCDSFCPDLFMSNANSAFLTHSENLRYGQFLVNELSKKHPFITLPEDADCFYDNNKVPEFLRFIYSCDGSGTGTVEQDRG